MLRFVVTKLNASAVLCFSVSVEWICSAMVWKRGACCLILKAVCWMFKRENVTLHQNQIYFKYGRTKENGRFARKCVS